MNPSKNDLFFLLFALLFWTSCQSRKQDSVIIFAFEQLSSENLNCSEENASTDSGLALMCKESIRFTHAFTTSLQPAAAMGSLLSASYPIQHGLRISSDRIDAKVDLLADVALQKEFRTGFFSGSPSILKKTGLSRSFEVFDDSIASQENRYSWSISAQLDQVSSWIFEDRQPFFAVIYLANFDLAVPITEEDDEKLSTFFELLKRKGIWDTSHVVLIGLKGQNKYFRFAETAFSNLHSENTNVAFLYKPPRQKGDEGINWKSDNLISIADIGHSLFCLLGDCPETKSELLPTQEIQTLASEQKTVLIEAPNPFTQTEIRFAVRSKTNLFLNAPETQLFNTLTDRSETIDIFGFKKNDVSVLDLHLQKLLTVHPSFRQKPWLKYDSYNLVQNNLNYWQQVTNRSIIVENTENKFDPLFAFNNNSEMSKSFSLNPCIKILKKNSASHDDLKFCDDELMLSLIRLKYSKELSLNRKIMEISLELSKREQLNLILRTSKNLSLENVWSLYKPEFSWDVSYKYLNKLNM